MITVKFDMYNENTLESSHEKVFKDEAEKIAWFNSQGGHPYLSYHVTKTTVIEPTKLYRQRTVPAENFMATIAANVDNEKLSDDHFREFIRNTLPIVQYINADTETSEKNTPIKSEKDVANGEFICFNTATKQDVSGIVDYSFGMERPGYIRIREHLYETSDIGNTYYVPIESVVQDE